jgi:hypothetical protein
MLEWIMTDERTWGVMAMLRKSGGLLRGKKWGFLRRSRMRG